SQLANGVGPIVIDTGQAFEGPLLDLRSIAASPNVIAFQEPPQGAGATGLHVYDRRSGASARIFGAESAGPLPRRVAISDELTAFYDVGTDLQQPALRVLENGMLLPGSTVTDVSV